MVGGGGGAGGYTVHQVRRTVHTGKLGSFRRSGFAGSGENHPIGVRRHRGAKLDRKDMTGDPTMAWGVYANPGGVSQSTCV